MADRITLRSRWCLTAEGDRVVPETHPDARFLHWREGDEVPLSEAIRLGAVRTPTKAVQPPQKSTQPSPNKASKPSQNKAG